VVEVIYWQLSGGFRKDCPEALCVKAIHP